MPCEPCKNFVINEPDHDDSYRNELQRKELDLKQKEKELLKKDHMLRKKIAKFEKRKCNRAEENIKAAAKLEHAQKQLLYTLELKDSSTKRRKKEKRNTSHTKSIKKKSRSKVKLPSCNPLRYFDDLLNNPCSCSRQGGKRSFTSPDSYLQRVFGRPCACKNDNRSKIIFRPCRCDQESPSPKQSYWDRAAGDCYLMSLRRPPQLWIYHRWPQFYPQYLDAKRHCRNCGYMLLCFAGILLWTPCLLCLELCKCCFCACCTDC